MSEEKVLSQESKEKEGDEDNDAVGSIHSSKDTAQRDQAEKNLEVVRANGSTTDREATALSEEALMVDVPLDVPADELISALSCDGLEHDIETGEKIFPNLYAATMDDLHAAAIERCVDEFEDSTAAAESSTQPCRLRMEPYMAAAKVVEPELVTATLQHSTESASAAASKPRNRWYSSKGHVLLVLLLGTLVVVGLVTGIVVSKNNRVEAASQGQTPPTTTTTTTTTSYPQSYPETFESIGNFSDLEEGIEPDLSSLNVSVSRSYVAFDLAYIDSGTTNPFTFLIDMKGSLNNTDRLEVSSNGEWTLSRLDPVEEVTSGSYTAVVSDNNRKNARIEASRIHLQDLFSKKITVYCEASNDTMPYDPSTSYYTLQETSTGDLAYIDDPVGDVDVSPDFTGLNVFANETKVYLTLAVEGRISSDDFDVTISMDGPPGIDPNDRLTVKGDSGSWSSRRRLEAAFGQRNLQDDDVDSVDVDFSFTESPPTDAPPTTTERPVDGTVPPTTLPPAPTGAPTLPPTTLPPTATKTIVTIEFPRRRIPDLMTRLISVYSDKSNDRLPDTGEILLVDEQGSRR